MFSKPKGRRCQIPYSASHSSSSVDSGFYEEVGKKVSPPSHYSPFDKSIPPIPATSEKCFRELKEWMTSMKSPNSETFQLSLEKTLSKFQPKNSVKIDKNLIVESFECDEDSEGNFNDTDAFIEFESGQIYRGAYIGNSIEGQGAFQDDLGAVWNGSFVDGCLDGWVQVSGLNTHFHEEFFRRGVSSGCYRYLTKHSDELELQVKRAKYVYKWRECPGGGFLVETRSPKEPDRKTFLYPDLCHCIVGIFDSRDRLVKGQESYLTDLNKVCGVYIPVTEPVAPGGAQLEYEQPSSKVLSKNPLRRDFYEHSKSYIDHSRVNACAGEGLFAKTGIKSGELVALFNGVRARKLFRDVPACAGSETWSDFAVSLSKEISLDIPEEFTPSCRYHATTGHKVCHSFLPNATFQKFFHPRFGLIIGVFACQDIGKSNEILVNYKYPIRSAPKWYQSQWNTFLRKHKMWDEYLIRQHGFAAHEVPSTLETLSARTALNSRPADKGTEPARAK